MVMVDTTQPRLVGKKMTKSDQLRGATLCEVPGKGLGLVATKGEF